jgi:hypothetical protein
MLKNAPKRLLASLIIVLGIGAIGMHTSFAQEPTTISGDVDVNSLPPGTYTMAIRIRTASGQEVVQNVTFTIQGQPTPAPAPEPERSDGGGGGGGGGGEPETPPMRIEPQRTVRIPGATSRSDVLVSFNSEGKSQSIPAGRGTKLHGDTRYSETARKEGRSRVLVLAHNRVDATTTVSCPADRCVIEVEGKHDGPGAVRGKFRLDGKETTLTWPKANGQFEKKAIGVVKGKGKHTLKIQFTEDHFSCSARERVSGRTDHCDRNLVVKNIIITPAKDVKQRLVSTKK